MALDKETIKAKCDEFGLLLKHTGVKYIPVDAEDMEEALTDLAQAIYELGVQSERERIAKQFDEAGWHPYAEVIRNSNNVRKDCDSKSYS